MTAAKSRAKSVAALSLSIPSSERGIFTENNVFGGVCRPVSRCGTRDLFQGGRRVFHPLPEITQGATGFRRMVRQRKNQGVFEQQSDFNHFQRIQLQVFAEAQVIVRLFELVTGFGPEVPARMPSIIPWRCSTLPVFLNSRAAR